MTVRLHAALTLTNADDGDTQTFHMDTMRGESQEDLHKEVSRVLREFADNWDQFINEKTGARP